MAFMRQLVFAVAVAVSSHVHAQFDKLGKTKVEIPNWDTAVQFEVVASQSPVRPGDAFELAVLADIRDGYHLYGPDEPEPTRTAVSLKAGPLKAGTTVYPQPVRRELEGLGSYELYEGSIAVRVPVTLPVEFTGKSFEAPIEVAYQLCTDFACSAPTRKTVTLALSPAAKGAPIEKQHPGVFGKKK
jgi:hypothetical protein